MEIQELRELKQFVLDKFQNTKDKNLKAVLRHIDKIKGKERTIEVYIMQNGKFKCPYCNSNRFEHIFPKNKQTPVFLVRCLRCSKYRGWINKSDYKEWINGIKGMEIIKKAGNNDK